MKNNTPAFKTSAATIAAIQFLRTVEIGDTVTHESIEEAIGIDLSDDRYRGAIASARRVIQRDYGIVFASVHAVGLRRLNDSEIVQGSSQDVTAIRRRATRAQERILKADPAKLDQDHQAMQAARSAIFAIVGRGMRQDRLQKLELQARTSAKGQTLELKSYLASLVNGEAKQPM